MNSLFFLLSRESSKQFLSVFPIEPSSLVFDISQTLSYDWKMKNPRHVFVVTSGSISEFLLLIKKLRDAKYLRNIYESLLRYFSHEEFWTIQEEMHSRFIFFFCSGRIVDDILLYIFGKNFYPKIQAFSMK